MVKLYFSGVSSSPETLRLPRPGPDNFYYPPEWTPEKGSLNQFHGEHAFWERAWKLDQGVLIIRIRDAFHIWHGGCNFVIAKGVRLNAEK
ncbi:hypothetical protein MLD38_004381 [Melastoma candidum]|uniref:Uncharacterized protein n=1 Tax=Melastoma candidum TaxID=119954 RepID=A0ACB9S6C2_9MYRT|nr:hypothetical protein MLD38_004381 [Melastoma candidum]